MSVLGCFQSRASHILGGEITWTCNGGGDYIFELTFFRDCNGFDINTGTESILVWNHPTVSFIDVNFISRTDISPSCSVVTGSPAQLDCGNGTSGGNGIGAIEKVIYQSNPINLGVIPTAGIAFTFDSFSRSGLITNLQNTSAIGITLTAEMFGFPAQANGQCIDNSPQFLQDPYMVSCVGEDYSFNQHAADIDNDSLVFSWDIPLDDFTGPYNPSVSPANLTFETGFSATNPTPDASFNVNNIPASLNPASGELTFTSFNIGGYNLKVKTDSYRNGLKIASVVREMPVFVKACDAANTAPVLNAPFNLNSTYEIDVIAGNPVNFNLTSVDNENLQDGSSQQNMITATGTMFGANFTNSSTGCAVAPCATLDATLPISSVNGAAVNFDWQTDCDHLLNVDGEILSEVPYLFVFKIQDDYCDVPKVKYATVKVNVKNSDLVPPTKITCIETDASNDITINWEQVTNVNNAFAGYQIYSLTNGLLATESNISTTSYTVAGGGNQVDDYFVTVLSGCNGQTALSSDTVQNIYLNLNNPSNGEAVLQWNNPSNSQLAEYADYIHVYQEYPAGSWNLIDSVIYGTTFYRDTVDICSPFLNYQIVLPTSTCNFTSNIDGDQFEDLIVPDIPTLTTVSIDTLTGNVIIEWTENNQPDTYGYVIYGEDLNGNFIEIDTVYGISNTQYITNETGNGPFSFTVAAFDSCFTNASPPTYQTSAKAEPHISMLLNSSVDPCSQVITLDWSSYQGYSAADYQILGRIGSQSWEYFGQTSATSFSVPSQIGEDYVFVIQAINGNGFYSFSNKILLTVDLQNKPTENYLSTATVEQEIVVVKHQISLDAGTKAVLLQKFEPVNQEYLTLEELPVTATTLIFEDFEVEVERNSYTYRTVLIDSCGNYGDTSNIGETILLKVITDDTEMKHYLQWNAYKEFIGGVVLYNIYRGIDGVFDANPIATTAPNVRYFEDDTATNIEHTGKICYYVEAVESINAFGASELSRSNTVCPIIEPLIYIPNAFSVNGANPIFKPVTRLHQIENYSLIIYNRYGQEIFTNTNPDLGWDGVLPNGEIAQEGVYIYRLSIRDGNGIEVLKHGHVTLLNYNGVSY
ncbi:MAG: gliding motility-associated C-terminal domain-containing protein [Lishizhenia sp.]